MQQILKEYLEIHGYWVLFVGTFLEGEAILLLAGFLAFQGYLDILGVISTAWAGSFLGDQAYFYLGRFKGRGLLKRFHFIAKKFREALKLIEKYGNLVAFISRFT
ncbi:MAG: DedA family protein, partial [Desulfuromonadaceae bacterium]